MKKLAFVSLLFSFGSIYTIIADEPPVCHLCEVIREENKHKVNPYEYYEDYLKAQEAKGNATPSASTTPAPAPTTPAPAPTPSPTPMIPKSKL